MKKVAKFFNELITILKGFGWIEWLGILMVLVLLGTLAFLFWRRKHPKDAAPPSSAQPQIPTNRLVKVWRSFIRAIPWKLRSSALSAPLSLVIGEAGSGKTEIINQYAKWQGQDFRYHPSITNDPLLQIYQGVKSLVLEFSSALLYDTNPSTYHMLKKLWKHLPVDPQVVVVIDARSLLEPQPEYLQQSGQALLGKLKIFAELESKPLPLVLALNHMEKVPGFEEFCLFLEKAGIPLQIEFPEKDGLNRLTSCLDNFKLYLSRALVNCSSQDYLRIVNFLNSAPGLLGILSEFLRVAGLEQGATSPPIVRLCLLSKQVHSFNCSPFALPPGYEERSPFKLDFHAKVALSLLVLGFSHLIGSYYYQKSILEDTLEKIKSVRAIPAELYPAKVGPLFLDFNGSLSKSPELIFQPKFFPDIVAYSNHLLIREIRTNYLIPLLKLAQFEPDTLFSTNKILAILYATPQNDMGKLIWDELQNKPTPYMVRYRQMISDYVTHNTHTHELDPILNGLNYSKVEIYQKTHMELLFLIQDLDIMLQKQSLAESDLEGAKRKTANFLKFIDELGSHTHELMIMRWLHQNTNLALDLEADYEEQEEWRQKPLEQFLRLIQSLSLADNETTCPAAFSINSCLKKIEDAARFKIESQTTTMNFTLDGNNFSYTSTQWRELVRRSHIAIMLKNIVDSHKKTDGWAFFSSPSSYPNLELNFSNNGDALFAGKAQIDGRLTAEAFEKDVKPTVMALSGLISKLPVDANEKKHFSDFVLTHLRTYTNNYASAYWNYFRQFQVRINSVWELNYALEQIQQPNSPLLQTLVQIKNNTGINLTTSPHFQPFAQKLMGFGFIQRMMAEKDGVYPEFQKYQFIMAQLQTDLNSKEPYAPKKTDGDTALIKGVITPMGRAAWGMLLNEDGSYAKLVKDWLQNSGIPSNWQQPFFAPVQKVAELGTAEIKTTIDGLWNDIWNTNVTPLLTQFPFLPSAGLDKELLPEDLIRVFHPKQGAFWLTFHRYLAPLCSFSNEVWFKRPELSDSLTLPKNTFERLNAVQKLTSRLWDDQGAPKPLQVSVKPGLLPIYDPIRIPNAPLVALTYLREGSVSVLGFNQQAAWQKLALQWWTSQPAEVGMKFRQTEEPTQAYNNLNIAESRWNFFRLLQQSKATGKNHYQWSVTHPDFPQQPLNIEFIFQSDPWAMFTQLAGS
jgi:hypothetical protein